MIVACVEAKNTKNKIKGILARYMYKIDSKTFVWNKKSIIEDVLVELKKCDMDNFLVVFYVDNKRKQTGMEYITVGNLECRKTMNPLYLSIKTPR